MFGIMNGNNVCALMNKSNIKSNNIGIVKWNCNIKAKQPESGDLCGNTVHQTKVVLFLYRIV